jgi:hypothetical protein
MTQKVVTNDEAVTGSNNFFFPIFGTFVRYVTNLRGTFVENVKKSLKSTHPTLHAVEKKCALLHDILKQTFQIKC